MTARLVHIDGADVIVGLDWRQAGGRLSSLPLTYGAAGQGRIAWGSWRASVTDPALIEKSPLLAIVAARLADDDRSVCAVVGFDDGSAWMALFKAGRAVFGAERFFESQEAAARAALEAATSRMGSALYVYGVDATLFGDADVTEIDAELVSEGALTAAPRVTSILTISRKAVLYAGLGVLGVTCAAIGASLLLNRGTAIVQPEVPYVLPARSAWVLPADHFLASCLAAHEGEWPNALGWETRDRGCTAPTPGSHDATAWRVQYPLTNSANGNAEPARILRARMAEMIYAPWPFEKSITEEAARAARPIPVTWTPETSVSEEEMTPEAVAAPDIDALTADIEDVFAGVLDELTMIPAVTSENTDGTETIAAPASITLKLRAAPEELGARLSRLPQIAVTSVSWGSAQPVTLTITPERQRLMLPEGETPNV